MLERYLHVVGLTEKKEKEESGLLYDNATVSKEYVPEEDNFALGVAMGNPALGIALSKDEKVMIRFKGEKTSFEFDDEELYNQFGNGDRVELTYIDIYEKVFDFIPPDFTKRQMVDEYLYEHKFINAEKTSF